eukprot:Filipodium_phascolosomae@DN2526_c0_g1_i8.p1
MGIGSKGGLIRRIKTITTLVIVCLFIPITLIAEEEWSLLGDWLLTNVNPHEQTGNTADPDAKMPKASHFSRGRYGMAQKIQKEGPERLRAFSLGKLCHMVQLAISRELLWYDNGMLNSGPKKDASNKDSASQESGSTVSSPKSSNSAERKAERSPPVQRRTVTCISELRYIMQQLVAEDKAVLLSQVRCKVGERFHAEVDPGPFGYNKLSDLLLEQCPTDLRLFRHGGRHVVVHSPTVRRMERCRELFPSSRRRATAEPGSRNQRGNKHFNHNHQRGSKVNSNNSSYSSSFHQEQQEEHFQQEHHSQPPRRHHQVQISHQSPDEEASCGAMSKQPTIPSSSEASTPPMWPSAATSSLPSSSWQSYPHSQIGLPVSLTPPPGLVYYPGSPPVSTSSQHHKYCSSFQLSNHFAGENIAACPSPVASAALQISIQLAITMLECLCRPFSSHNTTNP